MKNKKMILFILGLLILVIVLGVCLLQDEAKNYDRADAPAVSEALDENEQSDDEITISSEEAVYEEWLAASVVTAISMSYPDFELQEILAASKTGMDAMEQSEGVYVKFNSGGETIVIYSKPLNEERTEKGTVDLHEEKLGFATFDTVAADTLNGKELTVIDMNALNELIAESLLVSLYEHY